MPGGAGGSEWRPRGHGSGAPRTPLIPGPALPVAQLSCMESGLHHLASFPPRSSSERAVARCPLSQSLFAHHVRSFTSLFSLMHFLWASSRLSPCCEYVDFLTSSMQDPQSEHLTGRALLVWPRRAGLRPGVRAACSQAITESHGAHGGSGLGWGRAVSFRRGQWASQTL